MSIHSEIKRLRLAKGWSHATLAAEVSQAEGRTRPLSWQTVQQWEREPDSSSSTKKSTAPSRKRIELVANLLGTSAAKLLGSPPLRGGDDVPLSGQEGMLLAYYRMLDPDDRHALVVLAQEKIASYKHSSQKDDLAA